ncbi:MAG: hypothetical protein HQK52_12095 [Oligoflexia bacterium]|nr:hypothetical protein [Oligoflexia bacterium]
MRISAKELVELLKKNEVQQGYKSKYLKDGLIQLMESEMRGKDALKIYNEIKK